LITQSCAFKYLLTRTLAAIKSHLYLPNTLSPCLAGIPKRFKTFDATLIAFAPRLNALANPCLFLSPETVKATLGLIFGGPLIGAQSQIVCKTPRVASQDAAFEFDNTVHDPIEEMSIMSDHNARAHALHGLLEHANGGKIQVIGWFVE
jgi:hypothetical protein